MGDKRQAHARGRLPAGEVVEIADEALRRVAADVDANTCIPKWQGERCDYGMAIEALLQQEKCMATAPDTVNAIQRGLLLPGDDAYCPCA